MDLAAAGRPLDDRRPPVAAHQETEILKVATLACLLAQLGAWTPGAFAAVVEKEIAKVSRTHVVLLGTGTPNAEPSRSGPAAAVIVDDSVYIIDCGPGLVRRAAEAALRGERALEVSRLDKLFLTHLHSDHTVGLPDLIFTPWVLGREKPLTVFGPPGTQSMAGHILKAFQEDIRVRSEGKEPANRHGCQVEVHEISTGVVYKDQKVTVTAFPVHHGDWRHAFGYRFEGPDKVIVISGDRAPRPDISAHCRGCDILIHEVYSAEGLKTRPPDWQNYHRDAHTSSLELGRLAAKVRPRLLVLTHQLLWGVNPKDLLKEIRTVYDGPVVFGKDLDVFPAPCTPAHGRELLHSPRLTELVGQLENSEPEAALDRFWREVAERGAPLVEPVENDEESRWVTFLFRGEAGLRNVVVFIDRGLWGDIPSNTMKQLGTTAVWYRTHRLRKDARFTYSLSVNDPLTPLSGVHDPVEWAKRASSWRPDPLNPRQFPSYPRPVSVLELPGALPQPYVALRPAVSKGRVQTHKLKSQILGNERIVWVYTPSGDNLKQPPRGLLILFDGGSYTSQVPTPTILDNLLAEGRLPPLAAVFIGHPDLPTRNRELACSDVFTRFLVEEMMPWLRRSYDLNPDPALTVVAGSSYGGLAAAYAAFRHPEIFGLALSQSGAFMFSPPQEKDPEWLIRQFAASPVLPIQLHLDVGLLEDQTANGAVPSLLMTNRHMRDLLQAKGYRVHYQEFNGGHEYVNWRGTLADGLIALLGERAGH